jgi:hypothetical protein
VFDYVHCFDVKIYELTVFLKVALFIYFGVSSLKLVVQIFVVGMWYNNWFVKLIE